MTDENTTLHTGIEYNKELETPVLEGKNFIQGAYIDPLTNVADETLKFGTGIVAGAAMANPTAQTVLGAMKLNSWSNDMKEYADQLNKYIQQTGGPEAYTQEELQQLRRMPLYVQRGTDGKLNPVFPEEISQNIWQGIKDTPRAIGGVARAGLTGYVASPIVQGTNKLGLTNISGEDLLKAAYTKNYMSTWGPQAQRFIEDVVPFSNFAPESQASILSGRVGPLVAAGRQLYNKPVSSGLAILPEVGAVAKSAKLRLLNAANKPGASAALKNFSNIINSGDIVEAGHNWYLKKNAPLAYDAIKSLDKIIKNVSIADLSKLAEAAETTAKRAKLPEHLKPIFPTFKESMGKLRKIIPAKFLKDPKGMAAAQYISRIKGITYKEAQELIKKTSKKSLKWKNFTQKIADDMDIWSNALEHYTGVKGLKPKIHEVPQEALNMLKDGAQILGDAKLTAQPKEVVKGLSKVLDNEEMLAIKDMPMKDAIQALAAKYPNLGIEGVMRDLAEKGGISSIISEGKIKNFWASGWQRGNDIFYTPEATISTRIHEPLHWLIRQTEKAAKNGNRHSHNMLKQVFGDEYTKTNKVSMDMHESLVKDWLKFMEDGIVPENTGRARLFNRLKDSFGEKYGKVTLDKTNPDYKLIDEAQQLAESGEIFPIPHLMDEANRGGVEALSADLQEGRLYAGKYSDRVYGTQSYEDLAKALKKNPDYPIELLHQNVEVNIFDEILNKGTLAGESITPGSSKNAVFLDKRRLEAGDYRGALQNKLTGSEAKKALVSGDDFIAVDKNIVNAIEDQLYTTYNAQQGLWGDLFKARKSAMLGSGRYLAGNLTTGVSNMLLNSNVNVIGDIIDSIKTQGNLSKSLGTYRIDRNAPTAGNKFLQGLANSNFYTTGKVLRFLDRSMQNKFAEIAANARLREKGIPVNKRMEYLEQSNAREINDIIKDVQRVALLNSNRSLIPKKVAQFVTPFQPFLQWQDTATQSTLYMLQKHPFLTNVIGLHGMTQLALDSELAQRYGLQVKPEKEIAHYYFDAKTGKTMKIETEFSPVQTSLKTVYNGALILTGQKTPEQIVQAGTGEIGNLVAGKNKYGHPLRNLDYTIREGNRYRYDENGKPIKVEGATAGEIVNGILKMYSSIPNVIDKTAGPLVTGGANIFRPEDKKLKYYQAEPGAFVGQILPQGEMPGQTYPFHNVISGDPGREITGEDMLRSLISGYASEYYPQEDIKSTDIPKIYRSGFRQRNRIIENINR